MGRYMNANRVERRTFGRLRQIGYICVYGYSTGLYTVIPDPFNKTLIDYYEQQFETKQTYVQKICYSLKPEELVDDDLWD